MATMAMRQTCAIDKTRASARADALVHSEFIGEAAAGLSRHFTVELRRKAASAIG